MSGNKLMVIDNNKLAILEEIEQRIASIKTIDEAKDIRDKAEAVRRYAKSAGFSLNIVNDAAFMKIQAERKAGEILSKMELDKGGRPSKTASSMEAVNSLASMGVSDTQSHRWQTEAKVPEARIREIVAEVEEAAQELTSSRIYNEGRGNVHFSSATDNWETPQDLFDKLNKEFNFSLDVCANDKNAKCKKYFTKKEDGLNQKWKGNCWMNPPYGDEIVDWVKKAFNSSKEGATVVCLVPARVDTNWWWDYCRFGEIRFLRGRLKFVGAPANAPFPSAVIIFPNKAKVVWWEWQTD